MKRIILITSAATLMTATAWIAYTYFFTPDHFHDPQIQPIQIQKRLKESSTQNGDTTS